VPWTADDLIRLIAGRGGSLQRHGKKHDLYVVPGVNRPISVPRHRGDLPDGTARAILRQAGIDPNDPEQTR
jgi:hypothetical protein